MARGGVCKSQSQVCRRRQILYIIIYMTTAISAKVLKTITHIFLYFYEKTVLNAPSPDNDESSRKYKLLWSETCRAIFSGVIIYYFTSVRINAPKSVRN